MGQDVDQIEESIKKIKNNRFIAPIIIPAVILTIIVGFAQKMEPIMNWFFDKHTVEQPSIEAKMLVKVIDSNRLAYNYELTNIGKGRACDVTCSSTDMYFTKREQMQDDSSLSSMLDPGGSMEVQGNPSVLFKKQVKVLTCRLIVEYLDDLKQPHNCLFTFSIDSLNYKDGDIKYISKNCMDTLAYKNRLAIP